MDEKLDRLLCRNHPALFAERILAPENSGMGYGFECGDGWFPLIETLSSVIDNAVRHDEMPPVVVIQVKEKISRLRFRFRGGNAQTRAMVELAESLSERIDQDTGHWLPMVDHDTKEGQ